MIVCICNNINESKLKRLIKDNKIKTVKDIQKMNICTDCKKCCCYIKKAIKIENEVSRNNP